MLRCELQPLRKSEIGPYIQRRLAVAGAGPAKIVFSEHAIELIYVYSNGIPRVINTICENALVIGCAQQISTIVPDVIEEVASDFHLLESKVVMENGERNAGILC